MSSVAFQKVLICLCMSRKLSTEVQRQQMIKYLTVVTHVQGADDLCCMDVAVMPFFEPRESQQNDWQPDSRLLFGSEVAL